MRRNIVVRILLLLFLTSASPDAYAAPSAVSEAEVCPRGFAGLFQQLFQSGKKNWQEEAQRRGLPADSGELVRVIVSTRFEPKEKIQETIRYLLRRQDLNAEARAELFRRFAAVETEAHEPAWGLMFARSTDGSPVALGYGGDILVFARDGSMLKGFDSSITRDSVRPGQNLDLNHVIFRELHAE